MALSIDKTYEMPKVEEVKTHITRLTLSEIEGAGNVIHTDSVYNALMNATTAMEARL